MNRINRIKAGGILSTLLLLGSAPSHADIWCTLSAVVVEAYDHAGIFVHGTLTDANGPSNKSYISICGLTNSQTDCVGRAADRRYALALAAQSTGKDLSLLFSGSLTTCAQVQMYAQPTTMRLLN